MYIFFTILTIRQPPEREERDAIGEYCCFSENPRPDKIS
jgi:hypothetical protein